jgi:hypothetical protein
MEGALSTNPQLRTLTIAVPALLLAIALGYQLGQGSATTGVLVICGAIGFLIVMALGRRGHLEPAILGTLIIGYFVGNRGFAQLSPYRPFFVGEIGMVLVVGLLFVRSLLARDMPKFKDPLLWLVLAFLVYACVRFAFDVRQYRFDAIRDFAVVYYAVFCFAAFQLGSRPSSRAFLERCMAVAVVAHAVIAVLFTVAPSVLQDHLFIRGAPLFFQKGDLTVTFSVVCIFFVANRDRIFGLRWLRTAVLVVLVACTAVGIVRAAILALVCVSALLWVAGQRRFFGYMSLGAVAAVIAAMFLLAFGGSLADSPRALMFKEKIASMVDITGTYRYETELGIMKADNNAFRRTFWRVMLDDTTAKNPFFGMGFGYDFLPRFEAFYARGSWEGLRSPHNYFITVYGRLGVVGLLIFVPLTLLLVHRAYRAARLVRQKRLGGTDFAYWCGALALLISGTFGVVLEGPMGAIPFWTLLGLALSSPLREAAAAPERPRLTPAYSKKFKRVPSNRGLPTPQHARLA